MTHRDGPLVVVGDALLDRDLDGTAERLAPDAPVPVVETGRVLHRPGGAGLAALLAARHGRETVLVTALGEDPASEAVRRMLEPRVRVVALPLEGGLPVKTRVSADGLPLVRIDDGGGQAVRRGADLPAVRRLLRGAAAVLVADYGRGAARVLRGPLEEAAGRVPLVWDPHPRGGPPVPEARLVVPSAAEAAALAASLPEAAERVDARDVSLRAQAARAAALGRHWRVSGVAVTLGERGALVLRGGSPMLVPVPYVVRGDTCGAGDCLAAAVTAGFADGDLPEEAVQRGVVAASGFVAAGGGRSPALWGEEAAEDPEPRTDPFALAETVRARGGTVVAAGGCFDLVHAGHVGLLEGARRIGDCLIVCLNSDASARRLKGPGRPFNDAADRARVLAGLGCVDAVAVFDEDTPEAVLRKLRPHVWVKGGDYAPERLPEAAALAEWGGQAVVLPYLSGRSTTALSRRAAEAQR
jgi:rfaE bifunctional protein nucleotidyltransferase chain/domain